MNAGYETTEKIVRYWLNVGLSNLLLEEQRPANLIWAPTFIKHTWNQQFKVTYTLETSR